MLAILCGALLAQGQDVTGTASLYGTVRNPQGKPVAGATLHLQFDSKTRASLTHSNTEGQYRFASLAEGVYSLRVDMPEYRPAEISSIFLGAKESKALDLTLEPAASVSQGGLTTTPQFFDPPQFKVSGVTDTTSLGGHGSDTVTRTRDAIIRETASLSEPASKPSAHDSVEEESLREKVKREPDNFTANHALGESLVRHGNAREAMRYLKHSAELAPKDDDNAYDLALAYLGTGDYAQARAITEALASHHDSAQMHHLLADIQEKSGNSVAAVREYQRATELEPSEPNFFDWGSELLMHHAPEPAEQIFAKGERLFPGSTRILLGLGAAEFAGGSYDKALQQLCAASDLDPDDPVPYLFLGKIQQVEKGSSEQVAQRLHRFVTLHPDSAEANYDYAVALWNRRKDPAAQDIRPQVESLLNQAVRFDPNFGEGYLQLGILHSEQGQFSKAIPEFKQAVKVSPDMEEGHYRLAQAYRETGQADQARSELQQYQRIAHQSAEKNERQRHEIQQFVYTLRDQPTAQKP